MYPQTKSYLKRQILKLIEKTNDTEHPNGEVSINDVLGICEEIKGEKL